MRWLDRPWRDRLKTLLKFEIAFWFAVVTALWIFLGPPLNFIR